MRPIIADPRCVLFHGDSAELALPENSVDAIVTDPPAGIDFMGKGWDSDRGGRDAWVAWLAKTLAPAFRALKPGGHALVWAIPRTAHWTAMALEDAGFEIRDVVLHLFGTGFPKSLTSKSADIPPETGTALKPAAEHWVLARKPLEGAYADNFARYGTGLLQIDACRIGTDDTRSPSGNRPRLQGQADLGMGAGAVAGSECGRWPANVTLDDVAATALDEQSGISRDGVAGKRSGGFQRDGYVGGQNASGWADKAVGFGGAGGASRFFYVAKPSPSERDQGLGHLPVKTGGQATGREDGSAGVANPRAGAGRGGGRRNFHPTVKSTALMRWLVRLITPPGGVVLDPFAGSGSTGVAALAEGFSFVGVEHGGEDGEYLPIVEGRLRHALGGSS